MNSLYKTKALQGALVMGLLSPLPSEAGFVTFMKGLKDKVVSPLVKKNETHSLGSAAEQEAKKLSKESIQFIQNYATDLTDLARRGFLKDDFVGRDKEMREIIHILNNSGDQTSKNPLIYGDPGVGKTQIVKKLAYLIAMKPETLPKKLRNLKIIQLNTQAFTSSAGGMNAQTKIDQLNKFLSDNDDVILFVDELQTLTSSGPGETNYLSLMLPTLLGEATNMKPGTQVRVIATTMTNSKDSILKIEGISRRFSPVLFAEGELYEIVNILEPELAKIRTRHGVNVSIDILELVVSLSQKHWPNLKNPSSSKKILWEIASRIESGRSMEPMFLVNLRSTLDQKNAALRSVRAKKDSGPYYILREYQISKEIDELEEKLHVTQREWNDFQNNYGHLREVLTELEQIKGSFEQILTKTRRNISTDVTKINQLAIELLKGLKQLNINLNQTTLDELATYFSRIKGFQLSDILLLQRLVDQIESDAALVAQRVNLSVQLPVRLVDQITEEDVFHYISEQTNKHIDVIRLGSQGQQTLSKNLKKELNRTIVGQDHVVEAIVRTVKNMENGTSTNNKAIAFLLVGGSRTGKTLTGEEVGKFLSREGGLRLKMGEYQNPHSVQSFTKAPPSYVGYGDSIPLVEYVKRNQVSVVTFDEIDRAHKNVKDYLIGMLDDGYMEDHLGQKVDISGVTFIFTSNVTQNVNPATLKRFTDPEKRKKYLETLINQENPVIFEPAFLNRMTGIHRMNEFSEKTKILLANRIWENSFRPSITEKTKMDIHLDAEVFWYLGLHSEGGNAAKVKQIIESKLINKISDFIDSGNARKGDFIDVSLDPQKIETENPFIITVRGDLRGASQETVFQAVAQREQRAFLEPLLEKIPDEIRETPFTPQEMDEAIKNLIEESDMLARLRNNLPAVQPENVKE